MYISDELYAQQYSQYYRFLFESYFVVRVIVVVPNCTSRMSTMPSSTTSITGTLYTFGIFFGSMEFSFIVHVIVVVPNCLPKLPLVLGLYCCIFLM